MDLFYKQIHIPDIIQTPFYITFDHAKIFLNSVAFPITGMLNIIAVLFHYKNRQRGNCAPLQ